MLTAEEKLAIAKYVKEKNLANANKLSGSVVMVAL